MAKEEVFSIVISPSVDKEQLEAVKEKIRKTFGKDVLLIMKIDESSLAKEVISVTKKISDKAKIDVKTEIDTKKDAATLDKFKNEINELNKDIKVNIETEIDTKKIADLKTEINDINAKVEVKADIDTDDFKIKINNFNRDATEYQPVIEYPVTADTTPAKEDISKLQNEVKNDGIKLTIDTKDTEKSITDIDTKLQKIRKTQEKDIKAKVEVKVEDKQVDNTETKIEKLKQQIEEISGLKVDIKAEATEVAGIKKQIEELAGQKVQIHFEGKGAQKFIESFKSGYIAANDCQKVLHRVDTAINNVGLRSLQLQSIGGRLKDMSRESRSLNSTLEATGLVFQGLARVSFRDLKQDFISIGQEARAGIISVKALGKELKDAISGAQVNRGVAALKQIPQVMKISVRGAQSFGMAMKGAFSVIQVALSAIQALTSAAFYLIKGLEDKIRKTMETSPPALKMMVGALLGIEFDAVDKTVQLMEKDAEAIKNLQNQLGEFEKGTRGVFSTEEIEGYTDKIKELQTAIAKCELEMVRLDDGGKYLDTGQRERLESLKQQVYSHNEHITAINKVMELMTQEEAKVEDLSKALEQLKAQTLQIQAEIDRLTFGDDYKNQIDMQIKDLENKKKITANAHKNELDDQKKHFEELKKQYEKNKKNITDYNEKLKQLDEDHKNIKNEINNKYKAQEKLDELKHQKELANILANSPLRKRATSDTAQQFHDKLLDLKKYHEAERLYAERMAEIEIDTYKKLQKKKKISEAEMLAETEKITKKTAERIIEVEKIFQIQIKNIVDDYNNANTGQIKSFADSITDGMVKVINDGKKQVKALGEALNNEMMGMMNLKISIEEDIDIKNEMNRLLTENQTIIKDNIDGFFNTINDKIKTGAKITNNEIGNELQKIFKMDGIALTPAEQEMIINDITKSVGKLTEQIAKNTKQKFREMVQKMIDEKEVRTINDKFQDIANNIASFQIYDPYRGMKDIKKAENEYKKDLEEQHNVLEKQLRYNEISMKEYYEQIEKLEAEHNEKLLELKKKYYSEVAKVNDSMLQNIANVFNEDYINNIKKMNEAQKLVDTVKGNEGNIADKFGISLEEVNLQLKEAEADAKKFSDALPEDTAMAGMFGMLTSINGAFADGELNAKSFFNAVLDGAMQAAPGLVAMLGLSNPFAIVGAVAAITAAVTALKAVMAKGMVEGGLVTGKKGIDKIPTMLTHGEYVIPADITYKYLPSLERLRYTGQWNNTTINTAGIERKLDMMNQTLKAGHKHDINVNQKVNFNHDKYSELIKFENSKNCYN